MGFFGDIRESDFWGIFWSKSTVSPIVNISVTESASPSDSVNVYNAIDDVLTITLTSTPIAYLTLQSL